jgi:hypothetical protein
MKNTQMMGFGYEGTNANYCIYLLATLNIFEPKNLRLLQYLITFKILPKAVIYNRESMV